MNIGKLMVQTAVAGCCLLCLFPVSAADASVQVPAIVQDGFNLWNKKGASYAFDAWKMGGLLENDNKPGVLSQYFSRLDQTLGNYKSYEAVEAKRISQTSQIIYLSLNFDRAVIYARFLLYRTDKGWVVQNLDFSPKPEAIMPWLAFAGGNYGE